MEGDSQVMTLVLGLIGGGGAVKLVEIAVAQWSGRAGRKRSEVDRLWKLLNESRDEESRWRSRYRRAMEYISLQRRKMFDHGIPEDGLPVINFGED